MFRFVDVCKLYVLVGDSSRFPAAFLASHFFTRSDVKEEHLGPFIAFACEVSVTWIHDHFWGDFMRVN